MPLNVEQVVETLKETNRLVLRLQSFPQVIPLAREILLPIMNGNGNGHSAPAKIKSRLVRKVLPKKKRTISAAQRKQLSMAAKARWAKAKKAGKTTIATAD